MQAPGFARAANSAIDARFAARAAGGSEITGLAPRGRATAVDAVGLAGAVDARCRSRFRARSAGRAGGAAFSAFRVLRADTTHVSSAQQPLQLLGPHGSLHLPSTHWAVVEQISHEPAFTPHALGFVPSSAASRRGSSSSCPACTWRPSEYRPAALWRRLLARSRSGAARHVAVDLVAEDARDDVGGAAVELRSAAGLRAPCRDRIDRTFRTGYLPYGTSRAPGGFEPRACGWIRSLRRVRTSTVVGRGELHMGVGRLRALLRALEARGDAAHAQKLEAIAGRSRERVRENLRAAHPFGGVASQSVGSLHV